MGVTIYDVASRAGVSISTVSYTLNEPGKVRAATRQRVLAAIDELGFVPRTDAHARARKGTGRIGVIAPLTTYPSYEVRLRGVLDGLRDQPYELVLYDQATLTVRRNYLDSLPLTNRLDGIIVMSLQFDDTVSARLLTRELPTVLVEFARDGFSSVHIDDRDGGRLAADHLIAAGHHRFGFIGESRVSIDMDIDAAHRLDGFRQRLAASGFDLPDNHIIRGAPGVEPARTYAHHLFDASDVPTAIFTHSDVQAVGVLKAIAERGWHCPDNVAVIGFDNLDFADYLGLTTVAQPLRESGRAATTLLLDTINHPDRARQQIQLPLRLIPRNSTKRTDNLAQSATPNQ